MQFEIFDLAKREVVVYKPNIDTTDELAGIGDYIEINDKIWHLRYREWSRQRELKLRFYVTPVEGAHLNAYKRARGEEVVIEKPSPTDVCRLCDRTRENLEATVNAVTCNGVPHQWTTREEMSAPRG